MTLLTPLGLALAVALPILVVFYLLKIQPQDREVGSTYLWERLLPDLAAHQPWQKPRFPPLFFVQAALLLVLTLAVSRPAVFALAEEGVAVVLVLDATASMSATDEAPSRFDRARDLAKATVAALPDGSTGTLIVAGAHPAVPVAETADRRTLLAALDAARSQDTAGDLGDALRLATAIARSRPRGRIEVFTDGALDLPADLRDQPIPAPLSWHLVGRGAPNRAITAFAARADPRNPRRQQVFLRVQQLGGEGEATVTLRADGQMVDSRALAFDARGVAETVFEDLPDTVRLIEAQLAGADALATDDRAALVLERPRATRVLLVSRGSVFLENALSLLPNVELDRIAPRELGAVIPEDYDVLVFDTDLPDLLPSRPMLVVNPVGSPFLPSDGQISRPAITAWDRDHPLLRHVDLSDVRIARALKLEAPGWARAVVESADGPLVLAGEEQGRRVVVLAFDLRQSNLALTSAFPILVANAVGYLEPPGFLSAAVVAPGAEVTLTPALEAREVVVRDPTGRETALPVSGRSVTFADTTRAGLYRVYQRDGSRTLAESAFAANLLSPSESDLRPRDLPSGQPGAAGAPRPVAREGWWWLLGAGLVGLTGEWWWYHRR